MGTGPPFLLMRVDGLVAIMLDGGYFTKRFRKLHGRFPKADDAIRFCTELMRCLDGCTLYRIFFYDADPYDGTSKNPISKQTVNFANTPVARDHRSLLQDLDQAPNFAIRRGEARMRGWKLGGSTLRSIQGDPSIQITDSSFVPDIVQKGVDMRIGLDMAALALKRLVHAVVVVTGDADIVPAMRFARREGLRTYLHTMGFGGVRPLLKAHADVVLGTGTGCGAVQQPDA